MRTTNGKYPEYHTSADDPSLVTAPALEESLLQLLRVIQAVEGNRCYLNLNPKCEPQLGRRGLYRQMGGTRNSGFEDAVLWVLNFSDGKHSLLEIAERAKVEFCAVEEAAEALVNSGLLRQLDRQLRQADSQPVGRGD